MQCRIRVIAQRITGIPITVGHSSEGHFLLCTPINDMRIQVSIIRMWVVCTRVSLAVLVSVLLYQPLACGTRGLVQLLPRWMDEKTRAE